MGTAHPPDKRSDGILGIPIKIAIVTFQLLAGISLMAFGMVLGALELAFGLVIFVIQLIPTIALVTACAVILWLLGRLI